MTQENIGNVFLTLQLDNKKYTKGLKAADTQAKTLGSTFTKLGVIMASAFAINRIAAFVKSSVTLASSLVEVQNVIDTTFGDGSAVINKFAKDSQEAFGLSELSAKRYLGTLGAMTKSMGISDKASASMSMKLTGLTGDLASFYNLDTDTAFQKLRSGISGETEPLKQLGINLSVANLEAYALSQGIKTSYAKMTEASKVTLRYNYLLKVTSDAQGDFAKTSDSVANQLRLTALRAENFKTTLGNALMPVLRAILPVVQRFLGFMENMVKTIQYLVASYKNLNPFLKAFLNGMMIAAVLIPAVSAAIWVLTKAKIVWGAVTTMLTKRVAFLGAAINLAFWQVMLIVGAIALLIYAIKRLTGSGKEEEKVLDTTAKSANKAATGIGDLTDGVDDLDKATKSLTPIDEITNLDDLGGTGGLGSSLIGDIDMSALDELSGEATNISGILEGWNISTFIDALKSAYDWIVQNKTAVVAVGIALGTVFVASKLAGFLGVMGGAGAAAAGGAGLLGILGALLAIAAIGSIVISIKTIYTEVKQLAKATKSVSTLATSISKQNTTAAGIAFNQAELKNAVKEQKAAQAKYNSLSAWDKLWVGKAYKAKVSDWAKIAANYRNAIVKLGGVPKYANGGKPPVNKLSMVGERGPELFVPNQKGTIISNKDLGNMGGNIDYQSLATAIVQGISSSGVGQQPTVLKINGKEIAKSIYGDLQTEASRVSTSTVIRRV